MIVYFTNDPRVKRPGYRYQDNGNGTWVGYPEGICSAGGDVIEVVMAEINSDVLAQLHRIHSAVNDGTVDKPTIQDALAKLWELLSPADDVAPAADDDPEPGEQEPEAEAEEEEDRPHRAKPRKKR